MDVLTTTTLLLALGLSQAASSEPPSKGAPAPAAPAGLEPYVPAGPVLTLDEALGTAERKNLDLQAARAGLDAARQVVWKAWSGYLPQVEGQGSYTRNDVAASITLPTGYWIRDMGTPQGPPAGGSTPGDPTTLALQPSGVVTADIQKVDQLGAQLSVSQALLVPGLWFAIRGAYQAEGVAEASVETARRDVLFGVAQAYYGVASLKQLMQVSERLLEVAQRQERDAEVRYRAGTVPKVALLRAQIDRARAEQDLRKVRNSHGSAKLALASLLDRDEAFEVEMPGEVALPGDFSRLEEQALKERPEVRAAVLGEGAAASATRATTMRYLPSVGAFFQQRWANIGGFTGSATAWAAGVGVSWTFLDGGLREAELREARARQAQAEAQRLATELRVRTEVKQALIDLDSARANAATAREQRDLAAENQRLVDVSFKAGAATAVEQADATAALRNAEISMAAEELATQLAALKVLKAAGAFDPLRGRSP